MARATSAGNGGVARVRGWLLVLASFVAAAVLVAVLVTIVSVLAWIVLGLLDVLPDPDRQWPRLSAWAILSVPAVAMLLAFLVSRRAEAGTFYAQQDANRLISMLLLLTIVGLLVAVGEIIVVSLTFDAYGALAGAGAATVAGLGAAGYAHFRGPNAVLAASGARLVADEVLPGAKAPSASDRVLLNVVRELSTAANMPPPRVYVIDDSGLNAMAVGTRPGNAAIAVTRGMVESFDREQLQGVVAHELGHIRNLDSRYGVYVAILVGLVALVTDGFLRMVLHAWREGLFLRGGGLLGDSDDAKGAIAGLLAGVGIGLVLLVVAGLLRVFAPLASLLVRAAVSRQREYLADATSVELTRNPTALARALAALRDQPARLRFANRGSQHLWFDSPVGLDDDVGWHLLATHPTLDARIARLSALYPAGALPRSLPRPAAVDLHLEADGQEGPYQDDQPQPGDVLQRR